LYKKSISILILGFLLATGVISANAGQYMGEYFNKSPATYTLKIIVACNFIGTSYSSIPTNQWIATVLSGAGASSSGTLSSDSFQSLVGLEPSGRVTWDPQYWVLSTWHPLGEWNLGNSGYSYPAFYTRMDIYKPSTQYKCLFSVYSYPTQNDITKDTPIVYTTSVVCPDQTNDRYIYVGTRTDTTSNQETRLAKFTQCGVETSGYQPTHTWVIKNWEFGWQQSNGYWHFDGGISVRGGIATQGGDSYITHSSSTWAAVGGPPLYAKYISSGTGADMVTWQNCIQSQMTPDDTTLWIATGTPSTPPTVPFL
jgi:hypothetical protein